MTGNVEIFSTKYFFILILLNNFAKMTELLTKIGVPNKRVCGVPSHKTFKNVFFLSLVLVFIVDEIFKKNLRVNCKLFMAWTESQGTEYLNFE